MNAEEVKYNQPSLMPVPKVATAGLAGVIVTALIAIANAFGIAIPEEVTGAALTLVAAVTTLITFIAAYLKRDKKPAEAVPIIQGQVESDNLWRSDGKG